MFYKLRMKMTLRSKIALSFAAVILASGLLTTLTGIKLLGSGMIKEVQDRVKLDLNSAHEIYYERLRYIETVIKFTAIRNSLKLLLLKEDRRNIGILLDEVRRQSNLDIITVTDASGRVILRARNIKEYGDDQTKNPLVAAAIQNTKVVSSTEIVSADFLKKEGSDLAERAHFKLISTPKSKLQEKFEETSGMLILSAAPIMERGKLIGVVYGGDLLSRNYDLVDKVKNIVYKNQKYKGVDIGTVTIFMGDTRISTNVLNENGERAIGTSISEVVRDKVLVKGEDWVDEAFVVRDWYITAYEPIKDLGGKIIGILYVGILKKPFADARLGVTAVFLGIAVLGFLIVIIVSNFVAGKISKPLRKMRDVAKQIAAGDYSKDIEIKSTDVVGELAEAFNTMTKKLLGIQDELQQWVKTLEDKVEARTKEIKDIQKELIQIEKMASVGRLAAGVAHEINNPLTGILTNASLLMEEFPEDSSKYEDLKTIVNETLRCRKIVKDLLDFSRQTAPERKFMEINQVIDRTCELVWNQISFKNISINKEFDKTIPEVMIDRDQTTQVFMNILLNAVDAMPKGGDIKVTTKLSSDAKFIEIYFKDTGIGIDPGDIDRLFDPFFTTKTHGTGLGLAISYGIIQQHGGTIDVESEKGKGSLFIVRIPVPSEMEN